MIDSPMYFTVHGILTDGDDNVDRMSSLLGERGFQASEIKQKKRYAFTAPFFAKKDAKQILRCTRSIATNSVLICHSYGCLKGCFAARVAEFRAVFLFAPAMEEEWDFNGATPADRYFCIYTPHDRAIRLGSWIPFGHLFGDAGLHGFHDNRVTSICASDITGHSKFFEDENIVQWTDYVVGTVDNLYHE